MTTPAKPIPVISLKAALSGFGFTVKDTIDTFESSLDWFDGRVIPISIRGQLSALLLCLRRVHFSSVPDKHGLLFDARKQHRPSHFSADIAGVQDLLHKIEEQVK